MQSKQRWRKPKLQGEFLEIHTLLGKEKGHVVYIVNLNEVFLFTPLMNNIQGFGKLQGPHKNKIVVHLPHLRAVRFNIFWSWFVKSMENISRLVTISKSLDKIQ